jgi:hypothetical protein
MRSFRPFFLSLWLAVVWLATTPAQAEKRVALVMGNSAYQHTRILPNPKNDAEAVAKLLRTIGFADVTSKSDLDYRTMREAVRGFGLTAREADIALIYYAGHGLELGGENYLVPTDAKLLRDADLEYEAVTLSSVLDAARGARRLRVVVLDACRNNPLGERIALSGGVTRSVTRGLARVEPKGDVLVAYSARAGTLAEDGAGRHSPYAEGLLKYLATPGLDVRLMFGKVRDQVLVATGQRQEPYIYGSLSGDVIALVPGPPHDPKADEAARKAFEAERAWVDARHTKSIPVLESFVAQYGGTFQATLAQERIQQLTQRVAVAGPQAIEPGTDPPAERGPFDGTWTISWKGTGRRPCKMPDGSSRGSYPIQVSNGIATTRGGLKGKIEDTGVYRATGLSPRRDALILHNGKFEGNTGSGKFARSDGRCTGSFTAKRN